MVYDKVNTKKQERYNRRLHKKTFCCAVCKIDCSLDKKNNYIVNDNIWKRYGAGSGVLCLDCLEEKMGRRLVNEDFTNCIANHNNPYVMCLQLGIDSGNFSFKNTSNRNWIEIGDNPEGTKGLNKYIETDGDGWRGKIVAFNKTHKEAIIIGDSRPEVMLLVKSESPNCYPTVVQVVKKIPKGWQKVTQSRP